MLPRAHCHPTSRLGLALLPLLLTAWLLASASSARGQDWTEVQVPQVWKSPPGAIASTGQGYAWFRCRFHVPEAWLDRDWSLLAEAADDARQYYLNGQLVGQTGEFPPAFRSGLGGPERFAVPRTAVRAGDQNQMAIRLHLRQARTNFNVAAPVLIAGDEALHLKGRWEMLVGDTEPSLVVAADDTPLYRDAIGADQALATWKLLEGDRGPLTPQEALTRFQVPADLTVELAVGEPHVRQPLSIKFDARGRLWVLQYLQYPNPAGLTMVSRDKFLRSVYDKIPQPPPHHFPGADKISIHEDTDGDGLFDQHQTFVEGLSLASSFAFDRDGVWVLNPPYLLFYPDRDHNDRPDGDPEVHLEGFGFEDSHSIANSLCWGPDGWLYAGQGSTVTGQIRRYGTKDPQVHSMGQLIWRYHPTQRRYEIFAEGGGNTFGVEIDSAGRLFSGHNGGDTRGFHYVQGGYFQKGFGKHGELSNPHSYGYFPQMTHHAVPRFTHTFEIYQGGGLPAQYEGRLFGVGPLQGHVVMSDIEADRSSFKTKDVGFALATDDPWCRPVDIQTGPDGALYVADFYEQRIDHASHYQGRIHRESGRIYRLRGKDLPRGEVVDLEQLSDQELIGMLSESNRWRRETAVRLIRERSATHLVPQLQTLLAERTDQTALEALWALNGLRPLDDELLLQALRHAHPHVRGWAVRLACDDGEVSSRIAEALTSLASGEPQLAVRSQLACSARRLPAATGLPIVGQLIRHDADASDIHLPLLLWWAIEAKADADRDQVLALLADESIWQTRIARDVVLERLMRRYSSTGLRRDLLTAAELLKLAPDETSGKQLVTGFEKAFEGRLLTGLPGVLVDELAKRGGGSFVLRLRQGDAAALDEALALIVNDQADRAQRLLCMQVLSQIQHEPAVPALLDIAERSRDEGLRSAALNALQTFNSADIARRVIALHDRLPDELREVGQTLLASRPAWTVAFLEAIRAGHCQANLVAAPMVKRLQLVPDPRIDELTKSIWGELPGASTEEMRATMERLEQVVQEASGNPYNGRTLFMANCGKCHMLFHAGGRIGPDLTAYRRDDLRRMLANVVNPSLEIREGFENYIIVTADGRTLNGFLADQDNQAVTLRSADGQTTTVLRDDIDDMRAIPRSLMPEGALRDFGDQQVRDLFAYLRSSQPLPD